MARTEFPGVKLFVRSYDRVHTLELLAKDVDYQVLETFESALTFGRHALEAMGLDPERAQEIEAEVRRRDLDRLALQQASDIYAGVELMPYHTLPHEPFSAPKRRAVPLNEETATTIGTLLLTTYVLPFWIASVLLTVGLIGAIVIAREE